ncbi:MAG: aminotransferase class III-fold pyridoxal phosphate-dependent enzyme [Spirochaetales bacterium]|nr:aminotransferase class III-fold pyridoxal phosphate-dependent enzyme [Spirochaetales bacterium]
MSYSGPRIVTAPPGPKAQKYIEMDHDRLSPSLTRTSPLVALRAEGVYVEDVDGNVFLDFGSGIAVTALGHRHPDVIAAIKKQLDELIFVNSLDYYTLPQIEYADMLFKHIPGNFKKKIFYCNSGSEAVDTAIKLAKAHTRRCYGIGYINGFHGRTIGAISMTTTNVAGRRGFGPMYPIAQFVPYPYCYRCMFGREYPSCGLYCMNYLTDIMFKKIVPPDETAYIIIEPVQGAGGYIVPPVEFMQKLAEITAEKGILLIADEVQSGFGRTGKMFASSHFGIEPDIITCSKAFAHGLPAGAAVSKAEIMDWEPGAHEGTLNGGPVILEAAKMVLTVMERDKIVQRAEETGKYFRSCLLDMQSRNPCIGDVRGLGLMIGVEFIKDTKKTPAKDLRDRLIDDAFNKGLLLLAAGESSIRLAPPLIITREQLDTGLSIIEDCLKQYR